MAEEHLLSLLLAELNHNQKNQKNHKQKKHKLVKGWWVVKMMVRFWLKVACVGKVGKVEKVVKVEGVLE
jgi:hypothetical protein